jgi:hypothetical protein
MGDADRYNHVLWVVDQGTSTEEARGAAGDLLYRWGNPRAYDRGSEEDRWLGFQHDIQWIPEGLPGAGNVILYSNRHALMLNEFDPILYSRVVEWTPPLQADGSYRLEAGEAYEPAEPLWVYDGFPDDMFFSRFVSGVQRLPNGNTLVTRGQNALLFEVSPANEVVWAYRVPVRVNLPVPQGVQPNATVFRAHRYEVDFPGFEGRDLTPGLTLEDFASSVPTATARLAMEDALVAALSDDLSQRFYTFESAEDQLIQIDLTSLTDGFVPTLTLLDRDGAPVVEAGSARVALEAGLDNYRIPETDEYTLIISAGAESSGSGEFTLHISDVGKLFEDIDSSIPRLLYGTVLTDQITPDDASSTFVFYGEVGDVVTLSMTVGDGDLTPLIELRSAAEETLIAAGEAGEEQARIDSYALPASGIYYIYAGRLTDEVQADTTGSFELQLLEEDS